MKKAIIHVYVKDELKAQLNKEAEQKNLSLNSYINLIFSERK